MKDPLGIIGAETIFVMAYYKVNVLEEFETWTCSKQAFLVGSAKSLIGGTEQVEWFMDQTFTTTGNNVLIKLFSFVFVQPNLVKI